MNNFLDFLRIFLFSEWSLLNELIVSQICPNTDPQNSNFFSLVMGYWASVIGSKNKIK